MSNWNGKHYKGAMRDHRQDKRDEALERDARTVPERKASFRQSEPELFNAYHAANPR